MYVHLAIMGVLAVFMTVGFLYRFSASGFFLMITYLFLLEKARYLNHVYLICLLCFLMAVVPANRCWSVDAWLRPSIRSSVVPGWSLWLLRFQVALPMFFAGIVKLNVDWLTRGEPLRTFLADGPFVPLVGRFMQTDPLVWILVYGALAIDLLFVFYMTHRRTRVIGFGLVLVFHLLNAYWFRIGVFPWTMIVATLLFFDPDWPRRVWADLKARHSYRLYAIAAGALIGELAVFFLPSREPFDPVKILVGAFGCAILVYHLDEPFRRAKPSVQVLKKNDAIQTERWRFIIACFLCLWISVQILVPLRHFAIPGEVNWTEEGGFFSWRMMLVLKSSETTFWLTDPDNPGPPVEVNTKDYLTEKQESSMLARPEMILQFAHYIEQRSIAEGKGDVDVRAEVLVSLNGLPRSRLIDPEVDLTEQKWPWFGHADWILPLNRSLGP